MEGTKIDYYHLYELLSIYKQHSIFTFYDFILGSISLGSILLNLTLTSSLLRFTLYIIHHV